MTLQQLEYIVALDECRHYVTAAERCFVSQPNLTMQVKKLEEEIGVKIFDRNKKPLQPTEIGREVILRARQVLRETRQIKDFINHEKFIMEGEFTIGIIPTISPYLLSKFLPSFMVENPRIHLKIQDLQTDQIISKLESGVLDMGILATPLEKPGIREIPVYYEPFLLYLPDNHPFLYEKPLLTTDLDPGDILVMEEGHCFREQALSICQGAKTESTIGFEYQSGSIEALKGLVKQGVGYTLVPELSVLHELESTYITRFTKPEPVREVSIVVHKNFIKEKVIEALRKSIQRAVPPHLLEKQKVVGIG